MLIINWRNTKIKLHVFNDILIGYTMEYILYISRFFRENSLVY